MTFILISKAEADLAGMHFMHITLVLVVMSLITVFHIAVQGRAATDKQMISLQH